MVSVAKKKKKGRMKMSRDYEVVGFDPIGNRTHKIVSYIIAFVLTMLLLFFVFVFTHWG